MLMTRVSGRRIVRPHGALVDPGLDDVDLCPGGLRISDGHRHTVDASDHANDPAALAVERNDDLPRQRALLHDGIFAVQTQAVQLLFRSVAIVAVFLENGFDVPRVIDFRLGYRLVGGAQQRHRPGCDDPSPECAPHCGHRNDYMVDFGRTGKRAPARMAASPAALSHANQSPQRSYRVLTWCTGTSARSVVNPAAVVVDLARTRPR